MALPVGQTVGQRTVGTDGKADETGSLGEASCTWGAGAGDGIAAGATAWTTLTLQPGRYELRCNEPWHYSAGMCAVRPAAGGPETRTARRSYRLTVRNPAYRGRCPYEGSRLRYAVLCLAQAAG